MAALPHRRRPRPRRTTSPSEQPERLKQLIAAWFEEAEKFDVLPLDDRLPSEILADPRPQPEPDRDTFVYYPDTADVPESVAANTRGRSFKILAEVEHRRAPDAEGVIFAHGSRFGGHALFLKDQKLWYVYNFLGIPPEQQFVSEPLEPGKLRARRWSSPRSRMGEHREAHRHDDALRDDEVVADRADAHAARAVHALRRRALRRARLGATP